MEEDQDKLLRIQELRAERESLKQDIFSAATMDDEGMGGGEEARDEMEQRLKQIDLELEKLMKDST